MLTYPELLRAMHASGADYAWRGMNAAGAHGVTLGSRDFDFFVRPEPEHLDRARQAFRRLEMSESRAKVPSEVLIAGGLSVALMDLDGGPSVDLMTEISGPTFDEVWADHQLIEFSGVTVRIASMRHIVASKRAANRPQARYALRRWSEDLGREVQEAAGTYGAKKKRR